MKLEANEFKALLLHPPQNVLVLPLCKCGMVYGTGMEGVSLSSTLSLNHQSDKKCSTTLTVCFEQSEFKPAMTVLSHFGFEEWRGW